MNPRLLFAAAGGALVLVLGSLALGYRAGRSAGAAQAAQGASGEVPAEVTAAVTVVPIRQGTVPLAVEAYGSIVPAPGDSFALSLPFDCQVEKVLVSEEQAVAKGALLLAVTGSPDAKLALAQAKADAKAAAEALKQVEARHALKLDDDAALAQARGAAESAQARLKSLEARRLDGLHELRAAADGVVLRLPFAKGAVAPAGAVLAEVAGAGRLEARLGVQPSECGTLLPGSPASIQAVDGGAQPPLAGRVRAVSAAVNPTTRLADVFVSLPPGSPLPLGTYVKGSFPRSSPPGLVVPYTAVLPQEKGFVLFKVKENRAVRHSVTVLAQNGDEAVVAGEGLSPSDPVVVTGNYELEEGMAVKVEPRP
ncbi:MAG: efflux RND transporter periplasmic adaptor subunit [Acidobacteriota bacterium]